MVGGEGEGFWRGVWKWCGTREGEEQGSRGKEEKAKKRREA
jgi:hypothetical protein